MSASQNKAIRQTVRRQRRELSSQQQQQAAYDLRAQLKYLAGFMSAYHVGVYLANDGEIDPRLIVSWLWQTGKSPYLPVLSSKADGPMLFGEYSPASQFVPNQYGIAEPSCHPEQQQPAQALDVILMPLVAFDCRGNRIGMGGGYYDRTLAFRKHQQLARRPKLVGIAHHFQQQDKIDAQTWDIPLDAVVTDQAVFQF